MKKVIMILTVIAVVVSFAAVPLTASAVAVSAKGAVLINGNTGTVIYGQNEHLKLSMASTTKIMTALILAESRNLSDCVVADKESVYTEGSSMGLSVGDKISLSDLLYGMMLSSGNDAAVLSAKAVAGSTDEFSFLMNKRAKEIGMNDSHFVTPSGLDAVGHYSTAYDMALLARAALSNQAVAEAVGSKYKTVSFGTPPKNCTLKNHNKLLFNYDGMVGVKTGYTKKSGRCLVTAAKRGNAYLIAVTLNDKNDWQDHTALLDYGFSLLGDYTVPIRENLSVDIVGCKEDKLPLVTEPVAFSLLEEEKSKVTTRYILPHFIYGEVKAGDTVGQVEYLFDGKIIAAKPLYAESTSCEYTDENNITKIKILSIIKLLVRAMI